MACSNKNYQKSAQMAYNNTSQTVATTGTTLNILGVLATDCGCSIETGTNGFTFCNSGLYQITADVVLTPTDAGTSTVQLYKDGVAMPCAIDVDTSEKANTTTQHVDTVVAISTCCNIHPTITIKVTGVAGTVTHVTATAVKLA